MHNYHRQVIIFSVFFFTIPGCRSFAKELHETTLHHQPEASRHVKYDGKEDEVQGDPLVIGVVHNCVITVVLKACHELLKRKKHGEFQKMDPMAKTKIIYLFLGIFHIFC